MPNLFYTWTLLTFKQIKDKYPLSYNPHYSEEKHIKFGKVYSSLGQLGGEIVSYCTKTQLVIRKLPIFITVKLHVQ